ncbi:FAD-dependent oxidoreductase [Salinigranum sp. GCM10025319]|uniref:FAD-dependent oxidoreductase n=1 Tax=Salinigranum sp. GCM10025319 TaxID=3252687 RepID=UPI003621A714
MSTLCIVGAGAAGAGAAYALRNTDIDVTVLEKSRGVCGRAATRRKHGCRYDHGANYVKDPDDRTTDLLYDLGEDGLFDVTEPVWTFDEAGRITEGDGRDDHKFDWTEGMTQLAKRLFARTDAEVKNGTRVASIDREGDRWALTDTEGDGYGPFDALLLTPPAPPDRRAARRHALGRRPTPPSSARPSVRSPTGRSGRTSCTTPSRSTDRGTGWSTRTASTTSAGSPARSASRGTSPTASRC